jgi:hypothetical protein
MQSLNPLEKMPKSSPKKVIGRKVLHTVIKEQKINFFVTSFVDNFLRMSIFAPFLWTPSQHHIAFFGNKIAFFKIKF